MNIKGATNEARKLHKEIYQQEYDNLDYSTREIVISEPHSREAKALNLRVERELERKLLSLVE